MSNLRVTAIISFSLICAWCGAADAVDYKVGTLEIVNPWLRAVPTGAKAAAGYLKIRNIGTEPERLVGGSTSVAGRLEIHEMSLDRDRGVIKTQPLPSGLEIRPGETVELKPTSFHLMMRDLKQPIQVGKPFKVSLVFEKAGNVDVDFTIEAVGARSAAIAHDAHHHLSVKGLQANEQTRQSVSGVP
jgi:periplasmic copper chaperone A